MIRRPAAAVVVAVVVLAGCGRLDMPEGEQGTAAAPTPTNQPARPTPEESPSHDSTFIEDPFSDAFSGWDVVEPGQGIAGEIMGYRDETYFMEVRARAPNFGFPSFAPIEGEPPEGDIAVQVDVRIPRGRGAAGVICRGSTDQATGYTASINTRGGYAMVRRGGTAPRPLTDPGASDPSLRDVTGWNTLRLECIGSEDDTTLRLYINDQLVTEILDPDPLPAAGDVGLFVTTIYRSRRVDAQFDNFFAERQRASI